MIITITVSLFSNTNTVTGKNFTLAMGHEGPAWIENRSLVSVPPFSSHYLVVVAGSQDPCFGEYFSVTRRIGKTQKSA